MACTYNPSTLEAESLNGAGLIPKEVKVPSIFR